jgi:hypothetical protein
MAIVLELAIENSITKLAQFLAAIRCQEFGDISIGRCWVGVLDTTFIGLNDRLQCGKPKLKKGEDLEAWPIEWFRLSTAGLCPP